MSVDDDDETEMIEKMNTEEEKGEVAQPNAEEKRADSEPLGFVGNTFKFRQVCAIWAFGNFHDDKHVKED